LPCPRCRGRLHVSRAATEVSGRGESRSRGSSGGRIMVRRFTAFVAVLLLSTGVVRSSRPTIRRLRLRRAWSPSSNSSPTMTAGRCRPPRGRCLRTRRRGTSKSTTRRTRSFRLRRCCTRSSSTRASEPAAAPSFLSPR
jgi:hypothetical protein